MKTCAYCDKDLTSKDKRKIYCSLACAGKAKTATATLIIKDCEECGKTLEFLEYKKKKFCNRSCSAKFNNRGNRRHGNAPVDCKGCTKLASHRIKSGYCTTECRQNHEIELWLAGELDGSWKYTHAVYVRRYLEKRSGNACEKCGYNTTRLNGTSILQVDHIDGDWRHNRPENLQLLCPNCHCLTDTWGAGNMGNGRKWKENYSQF